jgi:hypothetical protein
MHEHFISREMADNDLRCPHSHDHHIIIVEEYVETRKKWKQMAASMHERR